LKNIDNFNTIFFDLDGTLVQSMENHYYAWKKSFLEYSITFNENEYYPLEGSQLIKIAEHILLKNKKSKLLAEKIVKRKEIYYNSNNKIIFYKDVIKIINLLKKNYSIGIVTATKRKTFEDTIPNNFIKKFNITITGDDTRNGKPSAEPYLLAAKKLNKKKSNCIVVENAPLGIMSAKNAGMFCIAISSTMSKSYLSKADIILEKFNEILKLNVINQLQSVK